MPSRSNAIVLCHICYDEAEAQISVKGERKRRRAVIPKGHILGGFRQDSNPWWLDDNMKERGREMGYTVGCLACLKTIKKQKAKR